MHKKNSCSSSAEGQANLTPTVPAGPVYEEMSPKEEIELNTNKAYGPLALWNSLTISIIIKQVSGKTNEIICIIAF